MKHNLLLLLLILFLLAGCRSSKPVATVFYILEYPDDKEIGEDTIPPLPLTIEITDVEVHPAFASHKMVMREDSHQIKYFVNNQWAVRPAEGFARFMEEYFEHNKVFQEVQTRYWNVLPDYQIVTSINHLEVIRDRRDFYARLNVDFKLIGGEEGKVVVEHTADKSRLAEKRNLNLFTDAISSMFFEELHYFAQKAQFELSQIYQQEIQAAE